jgi:hypothetical protein
LAVAHCIVPHFSCNLVKEAARIAQEEALLFFDAYFRLPVELIAYRLKLSDHFLSHVLETASNCYH